jgi:hypothetical protein
MFVRDLCPRFQKGGWIPDAWVVKPRQFRIILLTEPRPDASQISE